MKQNRSSGLSLVTRELPSPGKGQVLVKVEAAAICGTDVHIYKWDQWSSSRINPPLIIGHEFCGKVVEIGDGVDDIEAGERVTAEGHLACGSCTFCLTGRAHICNSVEIIGVDRDGAFAEYLLLPASNLWRVDERLSSEVGSLFDPLGNAVHAVMSSGQLMGQVVIITGCGPIGLCSIALARRGGAELIIASDLIDTRLELAEKMGADRVVDVRQHGLEETVRELTSGMGAHLLLEMSGHPRAINDGLSSLRKGGRAILLGLPSSPVQLDLANDLIFNEVSVKGINGRRIFESWFQMDSLFRSGLQLEQLITHYFGFSDCERTFKVAASGECGKVILYPPGRGRD